MEIRLIFIQKSQFCYGPQSAWYRFYNLDKGAFSRMLFVFKLFQRHRKNTKTTFIFRHINTVFVVLVIGILTKYLSIDHIYFDINFLSVAR